MKLKDFDFYLPSELIAQFPLTERSSSRLLCLNSTTGALAHNHFKDLLSFLRPNDLLVFNDTKVIPARLFAHKPTGGKIEIMVERILGDHKFLAQIRASKKPKIDSELLLDNGFKLQVIARENEFFELHSPDETSILNILEQIGHIPLPPYIERTDDNFDKERYQTIYAKNQGAVAAPTAGLHFDTELLKQITALGVKSAYITLHVGAGTFQPVRVENILEHKMHAEYFEISPDVCELINTTKKNGGRVIAIGTTSVRALETAAQLGTIQPFTGDTKIFIYPGYKFKCVDALITNFHLPKSTLLMLVCAFAGHTNVMHAYQEAIKLQYRFFSYGDAMFVYS